MELFTVFAVVAQLVPSVSPVMMLLRRALCASTVWKPNWTLSVCKRTQQLNLRLTRDLTPRAWSSTVPIDKTFFLDDYFKSRALADKMLREALASPTRFQSIDEREDRTDILYYYSAGKFMSKYRGAYLLKNPNDLCVYYQLFTHIRPRIVFELGTCSGASAMWYDDAAKTLDLDCRIYSLDNEPALLDEELKRTKPDTVDFITGDNTKIEDIFPPAMLESLPHPWLIVEDSHNNTVAIVEYLHQFMKVGDYLVVEDTSPLIPHGDSSDCDSVKWGEQKLDELKSLLRSPVGQNFMVDSFLTDLYGYNCTLNWHGFLRKCF